MLIEARLILHVVSIVPAIMVLVGDVAGRWWSFGAILFLIAGGVLHFAVDDDETFMVDFDK